MLFQLYIDAKLNTSLIFRYEVLYHESCAVGCPTGLPESGTSVGLSRRHVVRDLSPYTMYNVRIRVYNARQSSLSDEQAVRTRASGMSAGVYYHFHLLVMLVLETVNRCRWLGWIEWKWTFRVSSLYLGKVALSLFSN